MDGRPTDSTDLERRLRDAQAEVDRLRRRLADSDRAEQLREALLRSAATATVAAPLPESSLLRLVLETATQVLGARAGALFLVDAKAHELTFEVAVGAKAEVVRRYRVPMEKSIAGLVAATGQPMAISDAQADPRHAADIARSVGYSPRSVLCVPLVSEGRVIGVLELLDKEGDASFTPGDMSLLGLFALQAGVAIEQSQTHRQLSAFLSEALLMLRGTADGNEEAQAIVERLVGGVVESEEYRRVVDLGRLVQQIAMRGEREHEACGAMLRGFASYLQGSDAGLSG